MKRSMLLAVGPWVAAAVVAAAGECRADTQLVKGITGGALVGAEAVLITEAALGVQPAWMYIVGGVAGAGGGGVLGYYVGRSASNKPSSFLLAGGIALAMPAAIAVLTATDFQPPENYIQDTPPEGEPPLDAQLELPTLEVAPAFSAEELHMYGLKQATEVHVSVLRGAF